MYKRVGIAATVWISAFTVSVVLSYIWKPLQVIDAATTPTPLETLLGILPGNLAVALLLIFGAFTLGALTITQLLWTGLIFGVQVGSFVDTMGLSGTLKATLPHALFELPAFWIAAAVGLGGASVFWGYLFHGITPDKGTVRNLCRKGAFALSLVVLAALVESYLTPVVMGVN